ncbi:MAG: hypothetical protein R2828_03940 [Saprospiraceae bacterium]
MATRRLQSSRGGGGLGAGTYRGSIPMGCGLGHVHDSRLPGEQTDGMRRRGMSTIGAPKQLHPIGMLPR